jgi:hypothetical protein
VAAAGSGLRDGRRYFGARNSNPENRACHRETDCRRRHSENKLFGTDFHGCLIHHNADYSIPQPIDVTVITRVLNLSSGSDNERFESRKNRRFVIAVTAAGAAY